MLKRAACHRPHFMGYLIWPSHARAPPKSAMSALGEKVSQKIALEYRAGEDMPHAEKCVKVKSGEKRRV